MQLDFDNSPITDTRNHTSPRVLHARIITSFGGGPEKTIINSPRFLAQHGYHGVCAYLHPPNDNGIELLRTRASQAGTEVIAIEDRGAFDRRACSSLLQLCRKLGVDIFHAHDYKTNAIGLWLKHRLRMKLVSTAHGWVQMSPKLRLYYALDRQLLKRYDYVFCVSNDILSRCHKAGVPPNRCTALRNCIAMHDYSPSNGKRRIAARATLGLRPDMPVVAAVGRLSAEKGFDALIDSVARLTRRGLSIQLAVAGSGADRSSLKDMAASLGLADHVTFLGQLPDVRDLYAAADIFVLSSLREGLPNVVLEAMAMQLPIIATDVGGVASLISDRETGLLVPPSSPEAIANAIEELLAKPELATQCAENARAKVEAEFSFAKRMEQVVAVYDRLLGR